MGLGHFTNKRQTSIDFTEPIYKKLAEVEFFQSIKFGMNIISYPTLTEQLNRIQGNIMFFNFNYNTITKEVNPLKTINDLITNKKSLHVDVKFHDKEGLVIYKSTLL